jgi:hypothetical protein
MAVVSRALLIAFGFLVLCVVVSPQALLASDATQIDEFAQISAETDREYYSELGKTPQGRYLRWQSDFEIRSWEWHLLSTKIIFFVVLVVVGFGIFVSWLQFKNDINPKKLNGDGGSAEYDVSAGIQSVSIKSKTIGAVILVFSGVFFFLYLSIVYPMNNLVAPSWHPTALNDGKIV